MGVPVTDPQTQLNLPAGFRFYPTDEELMVQYLCRKVAGYAFVLEIIGEVDLYKFDPWVLPSKAMFGEKEWYFFSPRDRKYPNGSRPNRVAGSGYWKATGTDKVIAAEGRKVGIKKALVFYVGKAPKGTKTNWIMHEYRLSEPPKKNNSQRLDDYVLCRIYKKNSNGQQPVLGDPSAEFSHGSSSSSSSQLDDVLDSFPAAHDRFLNFPATFEPENLKLNLQQYDPGSLDWANSINAFGLQDATPVSQPPPLLDSAAFLKSPAYETQGGTGGQRVDDSLYFPPNSNQFAQSYSDAVDPFLMQYPIPPGSLGFRL